MRKLDYHHRLRKPTIGRASRTYHLVGRKKWRKRILISLAIFVLAGFFYFLFYSDFFKIQDIDIIDISQGSENRGIASIAPSARSLAMTTLVKQASDQKRFYIFSQNNIFILNKNQLEEKILTKYNFEELKIFKKLPNKLKIKIKEKLPFLILNYAGSHWFLDREGRILEEVIEEKIKENNLPLVSTGYSLTSSANPKIFIKQKIFTEERVDFIKKIFLGLLSIIPSSWGERPEGAIDRISWFIVPSQKEPKLIVKTSEGWEIYFDSLGDPKSQLQNLEIILKEKIKENRKNLKYIDLRFGEKVYYH